MDNEAGVRLEDLRVEYGNTTALDGVDVTVDPGEFFTLVGPSGCGKTTTLRCIAGFEEPTSGTVSIGDESMRGVPPEARGIGVVFQSYALFPHMSVGENVAYGLQFTDPPAGTTRAERVAELLDLVDLAGFADRDPDTLSGGQRQRVALARALAPEPRLLLLDEPMSALDARLRERLRVQVRDIQRELGLTTVYVTHDQEEALAVSDRVAVVNDGGIEQVGTPRTLYDAPETQFVAEFLGDNNVIAGVAEGRRDESGAPRIRVDNAGKGTLPLPPEPEEVTGDGDRLVVCVRPERIDVFRGDEGVTADHIPLPASVESTEFLGDATRLRCDWNGVRLTARTDGERSFEAGESVTLGIDPTDVRVVERE
ncbi:ABC transporter ATP-binding protein [Halobaculum limi]|uniref:ABC transporter ATP-binding protein n=1 Tax=Halobaculum limi TaxID=3031916 RepID=UPI002405C9ED|nr:ABC transporter ATP-binding protein [Halobaculum sp. YSMS11]